MLLSCAFSRERLISRVILSSVLMAVWEIESSKYVRLWVLWKRTRMTRLVPLLFLLAQHITPPYLMAELLPPPSSSASSWPRRARRCSGTLWRPFRTRKENVTVKPPHENSNSSCLWLLCDFHSLCCCEELLVFCSLLRMFLAERI